MLDLDNHLRRIPFEIHHLPTSHIARQRPETVWKQLFKMVQVLCQAMSFLNGSIRFLLQKRSVSAIYGLLQTVIRIRPRSALQTLNPSSFANLYITARDIPCFH